MQLIYDGTMAGLLTAVFEAYEHRLDIVHILTEEHWQQDAFAVRQGVVTDALKARRVWKGLTGKLSKEALDQLYYCFLSELPGIEDTILAYTRYVFSSGKNVAADFGNDAVLTVTQTARKVWREKHRMEAFVRFSLLKDQLYYASVTPDYNVLPLIAPHFRSRYADQNWLICDLKRKYGISYNKETEQVSEVRISWDERTMPDNTIAYDAAEPLYQQLWKDYFKSTGIPARNNRKLHLQHVPLRYWKYLTEKQL